MKKRVLFVLLISIGLLLIGCGKKEEKDLIKIEFDGVNITPGETLDINKFSKEYDRAEVPDCAFGGKGIVYTFNELEISTNEKNLIYSVYVIDPNMKTAKGVALGDPISKIREAYEDIKTEDGEMVYTKGKVKLVFTVGDTVEGIEYILLDK